MAEVALKKLADQLNCSVCLDTFTDPKQLQCHRVHCRKCLVKLVDRDQQGQLIVPCPNCRQVTPVPPTGVAGLQPAFHINHLLDILHEHRTATTDTQFCCEHQERQLELYCKTCEKLICLHCTIKEHNGHNYNLVSQVADSHKDKIIASLNPAEEKLDAIHKAFEQVDTRYAEIFDLQNTLEAKICKDFGRLHEVIEVRKVKLISKLYHISQEKFRELASQREQLETTQIQLSSYLDMVKETLRSGSAKDIVRSSTSIDKQVNELAASLETDALEPRAQADIKYLASDTATKVCQKYGQLCLRIS